MKKETAANVYATPVMMYYVTETMITDMTETDEEDKKNSVARDTIFLPKIKK